MKKTLLVLFLASMAFALTASAQEGKEDAPQETVPMPNYTMLNEQIIDTPLKTHVELQILVSDGTNAKGLKWLLKKLYLFIMNKKTYKYHNIPTNVYIYAYDSYDQYKEDTNKWIAVLSKSYNDIEPTIALNPINLRQAPSEPEKKYGLDEAIRKEIWRKVMQADENAFRKAERIYPTSKTSIYQNNVPGMDEKTEENLGFQKSSYNRTLDKIAEEYEVSRQDVENIISEGMEKDWPYTSQ